MLDQFKTTEIIWDRASERIYGEIKAHNGDSNGRRLKVQILNADIVENLGSSTLSLGWKSSTNAAQGLDVFTTINSAIGLYEINFTTEMLNADKNIIEASLILVTSTGRVESIPFNISIIRSVVDDAAVQSSDSYTALTTVLLDLQDVRTTFTENVIFNPIFKKKVTDIDDTQRLQRAMDYCVANNIPLSLNGGTYVAHSLIVPPGLKMFGNGATIIKPILNAAPYNMTVPQMKWIRAFNIEYNGVEDSDVTILDGINFNGRCWSMWTVPSYDQEQASLLIASGGSQKGRLRLKITNCHFSDNVSDGIHIVENVDVLINNISTFDCFRGGIVASGGYSKINISNVSTRNNLIDRGGIDVEIDSPGYNGTHAIELNINNFIGDTDFDIAVPPKGIANINNVIISKETGTMMLGVEEGGTLTMSNSTIVNNKSGSEYQRLFLQGKAKFTNCNFYAREKINETTSLPEISGACLYVYNYDDSLSDFGKDYMLTLDKCNFSYIGANPTALQKIGVNYDNATKGQVKIINCNFDNTLMTGVKSWVKRTEVKDSSFDCFSKAIDWIGGSYNPDETLIIDNIAVMNDTIVYLYTDNIGEDGIYKQTIIHKNMLIDESKNKFAGNVWSALEHPDYYQTFKGNRTINVTHDPNTLPYVKGLVGDIAISNTVEPDGNTKKWECVKLSQSGPPYNSIWKPILKVIDLPPIGINLLTDDIMRTVSDGNLTTTGVYNWSNNDQSRVIQGYVDVTGYTKLRLRLKEPILDNIWTSTGSVVGYTADQTFVSVLLSGITWVTPTMAEITIPTTVKKIRASLLYMDIYEYYLTGH